MSRNVSLTSLAGCLCGLICLLVQTVNQIHSWFWANACAQVCLFTHCWQRYGAIRNEPFGARCPFCLEMHISDPHGLPTGTPLTVPIPSASSAGIGRRKHELT
ncbi:uncharacterized protein CLUP02_13929 [Colletotrichum lupini]|uniref:Secreted protein n=1 Tax=Colletotrichum lupini TaxID=145971 RepID=A0A9Q8T411_9PEZI|nr:uncharacterized protein CLUP02_13929 [Colletotrichum lupini]UQC88405.1 hypothetical protein CLUP02_13929 [Colletotrichum lupini]